MERVSLRELRVYRSLFERAGAARDDEQLAEVARRSDARLEHWILLESMKDKLLDRAIYLGVPCRRDRERCFRYLLELPSAQRDLWAEKALRSTR